MRRLAADGHEVRQLVRREPTNARQRRWWPDRGELDPAVLAGASAVVNLAGAGIEDKRWSDSYKKLLRTSRLETTSTIASTLAAMPAGDRPTTLLNASGMHYYGDTGDAPVDEKSPAGSGFLPELCQEWEGATKPAEDAGVRVLMLRTGFPLDAGGGLLKPMLRPFRLFIGGKLSHGRQWMPWISLHDWLSAVTFLITRADIAGPVNMVGPDPVRNAEFTRALAKALHRPAIMPIPKISLRVVLGEFANEAVASLRVMPGVLTAAGFTYQHQDLDSAVRAALHD
jgi:uncharacterized protein